MRKLITDSKGKVFVVEFIKKDGSLRRMNCRLGVKIGVTGEGMSYDPKEFDLIPVYDMQKVDENFNEKAGKETAGAFRMINLQTIKYLKINGKEYRF